MPTGKIFVVDDEEDILDLIRMNLEKEGYKVTCFENAEDCIKKAVNLPPDLIVLDLMLPGIDGLDACRILKDDTKTRHIPIIMLSAKGEESDVVTGLELGAEDYIVKPFSTKILATRIKTALRKSMGFGKLALPENNVIKRQNLTIDPGRREVKIDGKLIDLTFTEFEVLRLLVSRSGWVYTRNQIVNAVRGSGYPVTERAVDVQIVGLRKKLGKYSMMIETVHGVGYRFKD